MHGNGPDESLNSRELILNGLPGSILWLSFTLRKIPKNKYNLFDVNKKGTNIESCHDTSLKSQFYKLLNAFEPTWSE